MWERSSGSRRPAARAAWSAPARAPIRSAGRRCAGRWAARCGCRFSSVATSPRGGQPLFASDFRGPVAILIGGEGPGLAPSEVDAADERVTIPMQPPVESLNTAVSAALIVYEARRQRTDGRTV